MKKYCAIVLRAAAAACLLLGIPLAALPANAAVPPVPVITEPKPSGVVDLHQRPDGTFSWQVRLNSQGGYIASWERSAGVWTSVAEAETALTRYTDCVKSVKGAWVEQWASHSELEAHDETPEPGTWYSSSLDGPVRECHTASGWSAEQVSLSPTDTGTDIDIPLNLIGPGTHELFIMAVAQPDDTRPGQSGCAGKIYDDGWASAGCSYEMSAPLYFTVTVPFPPAQGTVLPGTDAPEGAAFRPTVFSRLPTAPLVSGTESDTEIGTDTLTTAGLALALTVVLAVVLAVLIALPTELLESTVTKNRARIDRIGQRILAVFGRRPAGTGGASAESAETLEIRPRPAGIGRLFQGVSRWWSVPVLVLGSVIGGFADPQFGVNWLSLRLIATLFLGFLVVNLGGTFLAWLLTRRHTGAERPQLKARPAYLLLILVTVVFARSISLEPALVFGTLLAMDYGSRLNRARSAAVTVIGSAYSIVLGLAAWWAYTAIAGFSIADVGNLSGIDNQYTFTVYSAISAAQTGAGEFASIVCVQALSIVPIALLPMAFMGGTALWKWKKLAWVITYTVGLAAYSVVLVPLPMSWKEISQPLALWVALFVGYALVAVGIWAYFRFTGGRPAATSGQAGSRNPVEAGEHGSHAPATSETASGAGDAAGSVHAAPRSGGIESGTGSSSMPSEEEAAAPR